MSAIPSFLSSTVDLQISETNSNASRWTEY